MKWISKILVCVLLCLLLLPFVPAARADVIVVDPGETVDFTIEYTGAIGIEGEIVFSDSSLFSNVQYDISGCNMAGLAEKGLFFLYTGEGDGVDGKIVIRLTVQSTVQKGSSSSVSLKYAVSEPGSTVPGETKTIVHTVTVRTDEPTTAPPPPETTAPPETTVPPETEPPIVYADTTALKNQISIAENLTEHDYTKDSWAELEQAVSDGKKLLNSTSQAAVDNATYQIKTKLASLELMDYSALIKAMDSVSDVGNVGNLSVYWEKFMQALDDARIQRTSGDQKAVDKATEKLLETKMALIEALEKMGEVVIVDKEVTVEVEPSYKFCNDASHTLFLLIMIISLVINVALMALIAVYLTKKRMLERDSTPLVNYNIDDDINAEEMLEDDE